MYLVLQVGKSGGVGGHERKGGMNGGGGGGGGSRLSDINNNQLSTYKHCLPLKP